MLCKTKMAYQSSTTAIRAQKNPKNIAWLSNLKLTTLNFKPSFQTYAERFLCVLFLFVVTTVV